MDATTYEALKDRKIYDILIGEKILGEYTFEDDIAKDTADSYPISMPYMSGSDLCELSNRFGLQIEYPFGGGALSRWQYMQNLIEYCIDKDKCSELLTYLFSKERFTDSLRDHTASAAAAAYNVYVKTIVEKINGILFFRDLELVCINGKFVVKESADAVEVKTPQLNNVTRDYIRELAERANRDVKNGDYDSAVTKARTLLEETFCYVLEYKEITPSKKGNLRELYNQVKKEYNLHDDQNTDKRIAMIFQGLNKIVDGISELRNSNSDAHGVGQARVQLKEHHAQLAVNACATMADFILSVAKDSVE